MSKFSIFSIYLYTKVRIADEYGRTLQGMFPNLDQEVIVDVVRAQDGHVGRAVDACLALTTT